MKYMPGTRNRIRNLIGQNPFPSTCGLLSRNGMPPGFLILIILMEPICRRMLIIRK